MKKSVETKFRVARGDWFDLALGTFAGNKGLINIFSEGKYAYKTNKDVTYRIMNHWTKLGLVNDDRVNSRQWRKFSLSDLVWHKLIVKLRAFGVSNNIILKIKGGLIDLTTSKGGHYPLFEVYLSAAVLRRRVFLFVYEDGLAEMFAEGDINFDEDCIKININALLQELLPTKNLSPKTTDVHLNSNELEILAAIGSGDFEEVRFKLKNGKVEIVEKTEIIDPKNRIIDLLNDGDYQDIQLKKRNGKLVSVIRKIQEKL